MAGGGAAMSDGSHETNTPDSTATSEDSTDHAEPTSQDAGEEPVAQADTDQEPGEEAEETEETEGQFENLEAGAGCTEIWEHLSKRRGN
jgi:hypothetical protein